MTKTVFTWVAFTLLYFHVPAQVAINTNGATANASAILDVQSSSKGVLISRLSTAQRTAIAQPAIGLLVFDTDEKTLYMYDGSRWMGFLPQSDISRPAVNFTFAPDTNDDTLFNGYAVSVWDQFAVVGAPGRSVNNKANTGCAYVYKKTMGTWQHFTTLYPSASDGDTATFGISVSVCGNNMIIGAPYHKNNTGKRAGAAYIYSYNGTNWENTQVINGTFEGAEFGAVVDISQFGNYAAISEPKVTIGSYINTGVVRVYNKSGNQFVQQSILVDAAPVSYEYFGTAMALSPSGDYLIAGAPYKTVNGNYNNGYVVLFRRVVASWSQYQTYTPVAQNDRRIGALVDVTDTHAMFTESGNKEVGYYSIPASGLWSGGKKSFANDDINGLAIDPLSGTGYVLHGNTVEEYYGGMVKKINADNTAGSTQTFSLYSPDFVIGLYTESNSSGLYAGAVYFGKK
jgi:hypothetical protein